MPKFRTEIFTFTEILRKKHHARVWIPKQPSSVANTQLEGMAAKQQRLDVIFDSVELQEKTLESLYRAVKSKTLKVF